MKKRALILSCVMLLAGNLFAQMAVDSTRTMSSEHLSGLRDACETNNMMNYYWGQFKTYTRNDDQDLLLLDRGNFDPWGVDPFVKKAIWGAVGLDTNQHEPAMTPAQLRRDREKLR